MHISPVGPGGFDESRHGVQRIRSQIEKILHSEIAEAEKKLDAFSQNALSYKQDHDQMKTAADSTQEKIDALFDEKKDKIMNVLYLSLSRPQAEALYDELKGEWHDKYNVDNISEEILSEPEERPSPEDLFRSTSSKAPSEESETLPGEAPGAVPDFSDIWKKIMEKLKEDMFVTQMAQEFTRGTPPSPELQALVGRWDKETDPLKKDRLFEEIKAIISGTPSKEAKGTDDQKPRK